MADDSNQVVSKTEMLKDKFRSLTGYLIYIFIDKIIHITISV